MSASLSATARLEARISTDLHGLLKRAAELQGRTMTDFVVAAVQDAAERAVAQAGVVRLSLADQQCFADALLDPPESMGEKLARYPTVPAVRLGRLAVDRAFRGRGLGGALLADALARVLRAEIAAYALVVDAKDEAAVAFCRHHGFIALPESPHTLFLPLATARGAAP